MSKDIPILYITYSIIIIKDSILSLLIITKRTFDLFHLKQGSPPPTSGGKLRALFARFHLKRGSISYFISPQWLRKSSFASLGPPYLFIIIVIRSFPFRSFNVSNSAFGKCCFTSSAMASL